MAALHFLLFKITTNSVKCPCNVIHDSECHYNLCSVNDNGKLIMAETDHYCSTEQNASGTVMNGFCQVC